MKHPDDSDLEEFGLAYTKSQHRPMPAPDRRAGRAVSLAEDPDLHLWLESSVPVFGSPKIEVFRTLSNRKQLLGPVIYALSGIAQTDQVLIANDIISACQADCDADCDMVGKQQTYVIVASDSTGTAYARYTTCLTPKRSMVQP